MKTNRIVLNDVGSAILFLWFIAIAKCVADEPNEEFLKNLPTGITLQSSKIVPSEQADVIGGRLGGKISRLSNSTLQIWGESIQINGVTGSDDSNSTRLYNKLSEIRGKAFVLRKGNTVIEFVGNRADLANKAAFELGLTKKPSNVRYRVTAKVATVDRADYMSCQLLFNALIKDEKNASQEVSELAKRFTFADKLLLRNMKQFAAKPEYQLTPPPIQIEEVGDSTLYKFNELPKHRGVPYATIDLLIAIDDTGLTQSEPPEGRMTEATPFWPVTDKAIRKLASEITKDAREDDAKVLAILKWIGLKQNFRYAGEQGTRWGTLKALNQSYGRCWDYSDIFVSLARASGVPTRQVAGWLYGSSGHVWAEYYSSGRGWQQVDPTGSGIVQCGIYYIPIFTTDTGEMPIVYASLPKVELLGQTGIK